jgi:Cu2+-exporting ATPase
VSISRRMLGVLRQNRRWALAYNVAAVPLAALGLVPPWLAAIGMSTSSIAVVLNAMRIGYDPVAPRHAAPQPSDEAITRPEVTA